MLGFLENEVLNVVKDENGEENIFQGREPRIQETAVQEGTSNEQGQKLIKENLCFQDGKLPT